MILDTQLWICVPQVIQGWVQVEWVSVLQAMIASLKAQLQDDIALHQIVTLHAQAGDLLAQQGERGLQAQQMSQAIYTVVNQSIQYERSRTDHLEKFRALDIDVGWHKHAVALGLKGYVQTLDFRCS